MGQATNGKQISEVENLNKTQHLRNLRVDEKKLFKRIQVKSNGELF